MPHLPLPPLTLFALPLPFPSTRQANWLRAAGVKKGDSVAIYMPMLLELPLAMLACARIGAVHSVVFGGFSAESLAQRMEDCKAKVLLTASGVLRGPKVIELKKIADKALELSAKAGHTVRADREEEHIGGTGTCGNGGGSRMPAAASTSLCSTPPPTCSEARGLVSGLA